MSMLWIFAYLISERLFELAFSRRNFRRLQQHGANEFHAETFKTIFALHTLFLLSLLWESYPWRVPLNTLTWIALAIFILLQATRYWCMACLGENWNARIVLVPGGKVKRKGPSEVSSQSFGKPALFLYGAITFLLSFTDSTSKW